VHFSGLLVRRRLERFAEKMLSNGCVPESGRSMRQDRISRPMQVTAIPARGTNTFMWWFR
jgi:hypothetical protein